MNSKERKLLILIAKALANLLIWKSVDGRSEALEMLQLVKELEEK